MKRHPDVRLEPHPNPHPNPDPNPNPNPDPNPNPSPSPSPNPIQVRLEHVLEYAQPLPSPVAVAQDEVVGASAAAEGGGCEAAETGGSYERGAGYCFMDSPGNDLESIAGQVASGCNLIP